VRDRFSFTPDGLHNIAVYGIEPAEVWQALHAVRRVTRQMSEDNDWDLVAAREMYPDEIAMFDQHVGGTR
jgi:hypothetical protein